MEFELWYLIAVPLLFAAGWYLRGYDARQRNEENKDLPDNYFRGPFYGIYNSANSAFLRLSSMAWRFPL